MFFLLVWDFKSWWVNFGIDRFFRVIFKVRIFWLFIAGFLFRVVCLFRWIFFFFRRSVLIFIRFGLVG